MFNVTKRNGRPAIVVAAVVVIACFSTIIGHIKGSRAATALPSINRYGLELVTYATVRRSDGTYRRMLTTTDALRALQTDGTLPDGTRILMETYYRPGERSTVFHAMKQANGWAYGSFNSNVDLNVRPQASCLSCHAAAAATDFTFMLPNLKAVAMGKGASDFTCHRGGRSPCPLATYASAAPK